MTAWSGARASEWTVQHLNNRDQVLGTMPFISGSISVETFARLGGSASLILGARDAGPVDWFRDRFSVTYDSGIPGLDPIPWGVYIPASPVRQHGEVSQVQVELATKMAIVDDDQIDTAYSLPANSLIIPAVVALIESTGEEGIAVTESDARTTSALTFEAGESKLTIINDLLTSANYGALWTDGSGQFRVEPYVEPLARPISYEFVQGEASIHWPEWSREQDLLAVPNQVVVVSPGTSDEPAIVGTAQNTDPSSPYSIPSRGRVISRTEEVSDMSTVAAATTHAQRLLQGGLTPQATLSVTHGIVPLEPGALVRFTDDGQTHMATVREMVMNLEFEAQCQALWREL